MTDVPDPAAALPHAEDAEARAFRAKGLLPCPFCGCTALRVGGHHSGASWPVRPVQCTGCGVKVRCDWDQPTEWNRRPPPPQPDGAVAERIAAALAETERAYEAKRAEAEGHPERKALRAQARDLGHECMGLRRALNIAKKGHDTKQPDGSLREAVEAIRQYGSDTLSGRADGPSDRDWYRDGVQEMTRRARAALADAPARQGEAEPVAWRYRMEDQDPRSGWMFTDGYDIDEEQLTPPVAGRDGVARVEPLYAAPAAGQAGAWEATACAWRVPCPPRHEVDALIFWDETAAQDKALDFCEQYDLPEGVEWPIHPLYARADSSWDVPPEAAAVGRGGSEP